MCMYKFIGKFITSRVIHQSHAVQFHCFYNENKMGFEMKHYRRCFLQRVKMDKTFSKSIGIFNKGFYRTRISNSISAIPNRSRSEAKANKICAADNETVKALAVSFEHRVEWILF